ncbi:MAG: hypothetical protein KAI79_14660 [Bacteroidales bacterium]|nr:hypothetical protein [Bacteroidales bacterium]
MSENKKLLNKKEVYKSWSSPKISKLDIKKITLSGSVNGSENGQTYHRD